MTATATPFTIPRRLLTGGDPSRIVDVSDALAFVEYLDEQGQPFDWDPELAEEGEAEPPKRVLEYLPAPELERLGTDLLRECGEFHLSARLFQIAWLWRREGGKHDGHAALSGVARVRGRLYDLLGADLLVWLAADHLRAPLLGVSAWTIEVLLHERLCCVAVTKTGQPRIRRPIVETFPVHAERYGAYSAELQALMRALETSQQLTLFGAGGGA